jgi:hypothetical protein
MRLGANERPRDGTKAGLLAARAAALGNTADGTLPVHRMRREFRGSARVPGCRRDGIVMHAGIAQKEYSYAQTSSCRFAVSWDDVCYRRDFEFCLCLVLPRLGLWLWGARLRLWLLCPQVCLRRLLSASRLGLARLGLARLGMARGLGRSALGLEALVAPKRLVSGPAPKRARQ